ncbi:MAG: APC family permease, partial [Eggerthellaceae bacterium]|nr:APC family permease [Eggerthellaceae bacterium]
MAVTGNIQRGKTGLKPYLTPVGAWALALGTAIGWGSLVVTSNSYLLQAGPWGSIIGLLIGAVIMLVIARNYHYMINCFPDAGGAYTYSKEVFGHDHGFLTAWFLGLTYIAMFWANATSLPLFAQYFLGDMFKVGFLYTVFGYDVYAGEVLLTIVAILLAGALCARSRVGAMRILIGLAVLFCIGIAICFAASASGFASSPHSLEPGFIPDEPAISQIVMIACISPWAFIGFENISHAAEEYAFPRNKTYRIMVAAVVTATALYVFVLLMSVWAYPPQYDSWLAYLSDLGNLKGIEGLPAFYAAYRYMGSAGVVVLMAALLGLIITSLIGNILALSRLFYALAKDAVLPRRIAQVNKRHIPAAGVALVAILSLAIPFLGRTAIGWIVDVTTIGATITYGLVSASTARVARARDDKAERATGLAGTVLMIAFGAQLVLPSLLSSQSLAPEAFFLVAAWGIIGFLCVRSLLGRDAGHRFGRSPIVWVSLLALVMFVTFVWMGQTLSGLEDAMDERITTYLATQGAPSDA